MEKINIAFCFDKNLWRQFSISLISLLLASKEEIEYNIYAIITKDITKEIQEEIYEVFNKYNKNSKLTFLNSINEFDKQNTQNSIGYYLRLQIPKLLENIDKIIYTDIDIVFNKDLKELYDKDMGDYLLFGVKDGLNINRPWKRHMKKMPKEYEKDFIQGEYINSGVLLLNLKEMRKEKIYEKFCELMKEKFPHRDQDILNIACKNKIKILPLKYNFTPRSTRKYNRLIANNYINKEELKEAKKTALLYHFINHNPWKKLTKGASKWWKYAKLTPYYEDLKKEFLDKASLSQRMKFAFMEYNNNKRGENE